jgi:serine/threonine-protein kinase
MVMEHLAGGTVADAMRLREYTLDEAVRWLHEAAGALDFAHRRGILHRDIKLANLLLDRRRTLHVADFGIAQIAGEDTLAGSRQVLGTASYLAPERILGRPATVASDLYSLAVAWFELLAGQRPFPAKAFVAQAKQHLEAEPPRASERNPELPRALDAVLARGMAKAPEHRWPSAEAFATAVERSFAPARDAIPAATPSRRVAVLAAAAPTQAHAVRQPARLARRPRVAVLAAGALGATVLAGGLAVAATGVFDSGARHAPAQPLAAVHRAAPAPAPTHVAPRRAAKPAAHRTKPASHPATPARTPANPVTTTTSQASTPAPAPPTPTAVTLETRGHALLEAGSAGAAIPVLRQAVAAATPGSTTYAYALFDLGSALRQAGETQAAVRVLYARLQIPNQTGKVRAELTLALQALGRQVSTTAPAGDHVSRPTAASSPTAAVPAGPTADAGTPSSGD